MKKNLLLAISALAISFVASAQSSDKIQAGVHVAWDLTVPSSNLETINNGSGVEVGPLVNIPVYKGIYVEPGVNFFYNTMEIGYPEIVVNGKNPLPSSTLKNTGIRVPLAVGYKYTLTDGISMSVFSGVQFNFGLSAKAKFEGGGSVGTVSGSYNANLDFYDHGWRKFDTQVLVGVKFHYLDNFFAQIYGGIGVNNLINDDYAKSSHINRNTFTMGVGYMF